MINPSSSAIAAGAVGLFLVACCSFPACRSLYHRFGPGKSKTEQYDSDGLYRDEDGKATEASQNKFSTLIPRTLALVAVCVGFLLSLACSVLVTVHLASGAVAENWLRTGAWAILVLQAVNVLIEPSSTSRYWQGTYAALSGVIILMVLMLANASLQGYDYADEVTISLMATQAGLLALSCIALTSFRRRPHVFYEGEVVDAERTTSFIGMLTFSWADPIIALSQHKKLDYTDLPFLSSSRRAKSLYERYAASYKFDKLWKTVLLNFRASIAKQWILVTVANLVEFVPQLAMLKLLQILERTNGGPVPGITWFWVALLGISELAMTHANAWLFWVIWSELALPLRNMLSTLVFQKAMRRKDVKGAGLKKEERTGDGTTAEENTPLLDANAGPNGEDRAVDTAKSAKTTEDGDEELDQKTRQGTINLVGVDTQRVAMFASFAYYYPGVLVQLVVSVIFLALIIGWKSLLVGLIAFSITIPLNIWASSNYTRCETELMELRDKKLALVTEALQGIRQIKFSALEKQWQAKLAERREQELAMQWAAFKYDAGIIFCYIVSPVLLSAACLGTYSLLYGELNPSVAFTTISILSSLEGALSALPELTTNGIDAWVSINRIDEFLSAPEKVDCCEPNEGIVFDNADIAWPADDQTPDPDRFILRNVSLEVPLKELTVISGKTGTGKSLLLASLIGEVDKLAGTIYAPKPPPLEDRFDSKATKGNWIIDSAMAFVAQIPWIENATIRENILFGLPYDSGRYNATIDACALAKDLEMLDDGDATEIGHNGVNLSGGQRWRLSFARALYSRAGILILDDIFSAVDAHVGRQLFEEALTGPLSKGRTRILVTHHVSLVIPKAKYVIHLADGTVSHAGYVEDLRKTGKLDAVLKEELPSKAEDVEDVEDDEDDEDSDKLQANGHDLTKVMSKRSQRSAIIDDGGANGKGKNQPKKFVEDEKQEIGAIKFSVYKNYLKASGGFLLWIPILIFYVISSTSEVGRTYWVTVWTRTYKTESEASLLTMKPQTMLQTSFQMSNQSSIHEMDNSTNRTLYYLSIYIALSMIMSIFGTIKYLSVSMASVRASRILFEKLAYTVLRTPLRWLDTVPVGRILNRFTADFNVIDSNIAPHCSFFTYKVFETVTITIVSFLVSPTMIPLAFVLLACAGFIGNRFIGVARSVKRLENNGKSPIFELFGSVLMGMATVRGYSKDSEYVQRMWKRIDTHGRAYWHLWLMNRWMAYRLSMIGGVFAFLVAVIIVASSIDAALAGFALSFALQYSEAIIWVLRCYANVELDMTACERVQEFSSLEIESQAGTPVPAAWPTEGRLEVTDLVCGYSPDLPPVLKGLSFTVEAGQRVGVVGRTGAGKSSLTLALFRFLEAREGKVLIDGIDVAKITLHDLRSRLAIIPQDPVLFSGSVRSNLDAFNQHSDGELRDALERVHLISSRENSTRPTSGVATPLPLPLPPSNPEIVVVADPTATTTTTTTTPQTQPQPQQEQYSSNRNIFTSLTSKISEGGLNLSQGQRQLLCLARAIVSRPKIMILDEATSAVDKETDELIQRSIRQEFKGATLLVIAHRLSTIADFDRILVMGEGKVVEFGTPKDLLEIEGGVFRGMVGQSGEREVLEGIILGNGKNGNGSGSGKKDDDGAVDS